jgi:N-acetylmuramate 1-kinase
MTARTELAAGLLRRAGWREASRQHVAGDASNRSYQRLTSDNGQTAILMDAPPDKGETVEPFIRIARHLTQHGFSAPRILAADEEAGFLLIEDLGDALFARLMAADPSHRDGLYTAATDLLVALHRAPAPALSECDARWLTDMAEPAFAFYADTQDSAAMQDRFAAVFHPLALPLDRAPRVLILRDYHAENLLWLPERRGVARVGLLDFQDALLGHPAYDLVSVLQDARRDVDPAIEAAMKQHYIAQTGLDPDTFETAYALLGAQRNLRIIGIFARLCRRDGKAHYVDMIPRVWGYLQRNLEHPALAPLAQVLGDLLPHPTPTFLEHLKQQCATIPKP